MKDPAKTNRTLVRGVAVLVPLQAAEQVTGLVSQMLVAGFYGATAETDAWFVAMTIVSLVTLWVTSALQQVLIPMFRHDLAKRGEAGAWSVASILLNDLTLVFLAVVAVGWLAAPLLVRAIAVGFDADGAAAATAATRIALIGVPLVGIATFLAQVLFSYQRFFLAAAGPVLANAAFAVIVACLAGGKLGVVALALGFLAGNVAQLAVAAPALWRHRHLYRAEIDFRHPRMLELVALSGPLFVTTGGLQIERVVDRVFGSFLAAGSLSALAYARILAYAPNTFLLHPLQRTIFPHFTTLVATGKLETLARQLFRYVRVLVFLTVPAAIGMALLSDVIVDLVYRRGAFDALAASRTSQAFVLLILGLPAAFVGKALNNTHLALQDTKTTMYATLWQIAVKIALSFVLLPFLAHAGIALAESLAQYLRVAILAAKLPRELRPRAELLTTAGSALLTLALSGVMAAAVMVARGGTPAGPVEAVLQAIALSGLGAAIYLAGSWLARHDELAWLGRNVALIRSR